MRMRIHRSVQTFLSVALVALSVSVASADVKLPSMFTDHMVIQRETSVPIWGWAEPDEKVTVTFADQTQECAAGENGHWRVAIHTTAAGGPHTLTVKGTNTIEVQDVLVGEVWLCSGQSNMAMTVSSSADFPQEQAAATCSAIRMFTVERKTAVTPQERCNGRWQICSPETVGSFSATAYFFGRKLQNELQVPIGLINSSWGGTPIQAWTSEKAQRAEIDLIPTITDFELQIARYDPVETKTRYERQLDTWKSNVKKAKEKGTSARRKPRAPVNPATSQRRPGNLFNGMIAPLAPYAIRGAIWYQGEANAREDAQLYGLRLTTMIDEWRGLWGQGDFPFEWVQLPNYRAPQSDPVQTTPWVIVREQMLNTLTHKNTGMAVTMDVGEANDIHPKNKQDVGIRLALWALGATYGQDNVWCGPLYQGHQVQNDKVIIKFDHVGEGLLAKNGPLRGFAIADSDKPFVWADARIVDDTVVVSSDGVKNPRAVRYAWAENPDGNLVNKAGLPASPFRTDVPE